MPTTPPTIDYTARDFTKVVAELQAFVVASRPNDQTDFLQASLGLMLLDVAAYCADLVSYGQDRLAEEVFLSTARRYDSGLRFARSVGYVPRSAVAASCTLVSTTLPTSVVTEGGKIDKGSFVTGLNGLRYEVTADVIIPSASSTVSLAVKEGQSFTETFTPTKVASQVFVSANAIVEQNSWAVFVGSTTDAANKWTQVSNVLFETGPTQTYEVFFDGDGKLNVRFGDGNAGKIPNQTVTITYRTTNGLLGNTALNTIRGNFRTTSLLTSIKDSVAVVNSGAAATGGQDRETIEELRVSVPSFIRSVDKATTIRDVETGIESQVGVALAFANVPLASYSGNIVRVFIWDTQQVDFTGTSPTSGINSKVTYSQYVQVPTTRITPVQQYLAPRTMTTTHTIILRPTVALIDLDFGIVYYDRVRTSLEVHLDVTKAVVNLFAASSGFAIRIADLYKAVLAVAGVQHFQIKSASFEHIDPSNPPVRITETYHKDPQANPGTKPIQDFVIAGAGTRVYYDDKYIYNNELTYTGAIDNTSIEAINLRSLKFDLQA